MTRGCNIPDCPDEHCARGLCRRHYEAARNNRPPRKRRRPAPVTPYEVPPGSETAPGFGQPWSGYPGSENRAISLSESKTNDEDRKFFVCPDCAEVLDGFDAYTDHRGTCDDEDFTPAADLKVVS